MKSNKYQLVAELLIDIEAEMRQQLLWSERRPSDEALASDQPFAVDTLSFVEWLQFIFIERLHLVTKQQLPLPEKCDIKPMAEEYFRGNAHQPKTLLVLLEKIDQIITGS